MSEIDLQPYKIEVRRAGVWEFGSSHSQQIDAIAQWQRFLNQGVAEEDLRRIGWEAPAEE